MKFMDLRKPSLRNFITESFSFFDVAERSETIKLLYGFIGPSVISAAQECR